MGLPSPLKRRRGPPAASAAPASEPVDAVQRARTRARQRLIGAVVLVGIGIIGFPLVFETQPRPIPVDIPIDLPRKDSAPALVMPPPHPLQDTPNPIGSEAASPAVRALPDGDAGDVITESREMAGRDSMSPPALGSPALTSPSASTTVAAAGTAPRLGPAAVPNVTAGAAAARTGATKPQVPAATASAVASPPDTGAAREASNAEAERARALLEGRPVATVLSPRYVVQVGAFADAAAARDTRSKVEKLGMKTYTQVADTAEGSRVRVRVGPFASRDEADKALAKARAAGLNAVVLTL